MKRNTRNFEILNDYCKGVPLVDCHDHTMKMGPHYTDPIQVVIGEYFLADLQTATSENEGQILLDSSIPWQKRFPIFEKAWKRSSHTGYAQTTRRVLKKFYDEDRVTFEALCHMQDRLLDFTDEKLYTQVLDDAKILVRLEDLWPDPRLVLDGSFKLTPRGRLVISLVDFHKIRTFQNIEDRVAPLALKATTLDDYLDACREIFSRQKAFGAAAFKDQSAYTRRLDYGNPSKAEAETAFNWIMEDYSRSLPYPGGGKVLDDFLFHQFMVMARDLELPVQIHTGHLAGLYGEGSGTNAMHLASLLMAHRDTRFDLFHANWPYSGDILFLVKKYPNVTLDFCWTNMLDPIYCQDLFRQALSSVPHSKIHAFGSDLGAHGFPAGSGYVDHAWAHAEMTRENIAIALSDMADMEYLDIDEAKEVAYSWMFKNPNEFFNLGLSDPYQT